MIRGFIIDISAEWVMLQTARGQVMQIPVALLPERAVIGDFIYEIPATGKYEIDALITEQRKRQVRQYSENFFD